MIALDIGAVPRQWIARGYSVGGIQAFGPDGYRIPMRDNVAHDGALIVTQADHEDGIEWIHASIAWAARNPTHDELTLLHRSIFGRKRWSYQVFAPETDHINIHEHALHLWGRADGKPVMPNFGIYGLI